MTTMAEMIHINTKDMELLKAYRALKIADENPSDYRYMPTENEILEAYYARTFRRGQERKPQRRKCPQHAPIMSSQVYKATTGDYNRPLKGVFFCNQIVNKA